MYQSLETCLLVTQEDFPMLPCNMSVRNSVCNPDKPIVNYVRKSIFKSVSTSSVRRGKPISDSNVRSSKLVSASASSVRPSKPIHGSNVGLSKPITSSNTRPSKPISGSSVRSIKPVSVISICPSKPTCGSNVCPSKLFSAIHVRASKSVYGSNVSSRKLLSVSDVSPSKTISVRTVCSSNSVSAIYVHPPKSISASKICSGKPVCRNNVRSSEPICRGNACQSKPNNVNILPCKPVLTGHICHVNSSLLKQQLFFILFLSILIFSVYYKLSILAMNIFTNLLLVIVILLSKLTCLTEFFILYISRNSKSLRSSLNTYITFQSFRTMLLLKTSEVSFFTNSICVFAMLSIIVLHFSRSNVQTNCFTNILQKFRKFLPSFVFLIPFIWQFNTFCIPAYLSVIFAVVVILFLYFYSTNF